MLDKKLAESFENLSKEFTSNTMPLYSENGKDYEETRKAHRNFIAEMKKNFYNELKKYNITVSENGAYDKLCTDVEALLLSEDDKSIIQKQKALLAECAKRTLDISSDSRDMNESNENDSRHRKTHSSKVLQNYKTTALGNIYSYSGSFEFLAADFYNENIKNLIRHLSLKNTNDEILEYIHSDLTQTCKTFTKKDVIGYQNMIMQDTQRSFSDLSSIQSTLFERMDSLVGKKEKDIFGVLSPEEKTKHQEKVKQAIEESKDKSDEKDNKWFLPGDVIK